jgi:hypothetical protein
MKHDDRQIDNQKKGRPKPPLLAARSDTLRDERLLDQHGQPGAHFIGRKAAVGHVHHASDRARLRRRFGRKQGMEGLLLSHLQGAEASQFGRGTPLAP